MRFIYFGLTVLFYVIFAYDLTFDFDFWTWMWLGLSIVCGILTYDDYKKFREKNKKLNLNIQQTSNSKLNIVKYCNCQNIDNNTFRYVIDLNKHISVEKIENVINKL